MSYILDAIKKSEQQRQHAETPTLHTIQLSNDAGKSLTFVYGFVAAILISSIIGIGWFSLSQRGSDETKPDSDKVNESNIATLSASGEKSLKQGTTAGSREGTKPSKLQSASVSQTLVKVTPSHESHKIIAQEKIDSDIDRSSNESVQEQRIVAKDELPLSIQQEIPRMSISGYAYSSVPKDRSVGINDRVFQEGEYPALGLKLEQINPDSLIFSYKNYLFRQSLQ